MNRLILNKRDNAKLSGINGGTISGEGASVKLLAGNEDIKILMAGGGGEVFVFLILVYLMSR